jgi:drug/metabolite transporter (DMT)-like permease
MQKEHLIKGSLFMTAGFLFVALFAAFFKAATASASPIWAIWVAYSLACIIQGLFISKHGLSFLKTQRIWGYLGRVIFGAIATLLFVTALTRISLLNATLLFNTSPLFVPILGAFLLSARTPLKTWGFLSLGFFGVILILNPNFSSFQDAGNLIGLAAGFVQALAFIFVKRLTSTEPVRRINFYFFFFSSLLFLPYVLWTWETPDLMNWIWALCAGSMSFLAQLCIVKGYHYAEASHVGPFQYAAVVFSGLIGWIVWNQVPSLQDLLGAFCIALGGALTIMFYKTKMKT